MRIAVATIDGVSLSQHFGQSAGFVVFEVAEGNIQRRELRTNQHTPHAQGLCQDGQHQHGSHSHAGIVGLLSDCEVVLCGGMGAGAAQALTQQGIQPAVLPVTCSTEEAVSLYLKSKANPAPSSFCKCQH